MIGALLWWSVIGGTCGYFAGRAASDGACPPVGPPPGPGRRPVPRCARWAIGAGALRRCGQFTWRPVAVEIMAMSGLQNGYTDPHGLSLYVASHVYPHTPEGAPVAWPPRKGDPPGVRCIWNRIVLRVHRLLATWADQAAEGE